VLVLTALLACADEQRGQAVEPWGSQSFPYPRSRVSTTLDQRGTNEFVGTGAMPVLRPDVGEDCVPALDLRIAAAGGQGDGIIPAPLDVAAGTVLTMAPAPTTFDRHAPFFGGDDGTYGWIGGEWEVVTWEVDHLEILLRGGESCEWVEPYLLEETCVPDSGIITVEPLDDDFVLYVVDRGQVGEGDVYPAPGGGYFCDRWHHTAGAPSE